MKSIYRYQKDFSIANASGNKAELQQIMAIGSVLSGLNTESEAIKIKKVLWTISLNLISSSFVSSQIGKAFIPIVILGQNGMTTTTPTEANTYQVDQVVESAVDREYVKKALAKLVPQWTFLSATTGHSKARRTFDITSSVTQWVKQCEDKINTPNAKPVLELLGVLFGTDNGDTVYCDNVIEIDFDVATRRWTP